MHLLFAVAVVVLRFTTAAYAVKPDSTGIPYFDVCATVDSTRPENVVACRLYRYACDGSDGWSPIRIREHPTVPAHDDTFQVPAEGCNNWWITNVNSRGLESCLSNGVNIGAPLAVEPKSWQRVRRRAGWYDLLGRRIDIPVRSGRYFGVRDTLVIR